MKILSAVLALAVSLAIVGNLSAEEKKKGKHPERRQAFGLMQLFKDLDLSAEQMAKLQALRKEYAPKFKAINEKQRNILTEEQKKARAEARNAAIEAGKKGKEFRDAVQEAVKLTDEQKTAFAEIQKERQALRRERIKKALEYLTPEQREMIKQKLERLQNRKPKGEKKREKE